MDQLPYFHTTSTVLQGSSMLQENAADEEVVGRATNDGSHFILMPVPLPTAWKKGRIFNLCYTRSDEEPFRRIINSCVSSSLHTIMQGTIWMKDPFARFTALEALLRLSI